MPGGSRKMSWARIAILAGAALVGAVAAFFVLSYFHEKEIKRLELEHAGKLKAAITEQVGICNEQKKLTEETDYALQRDLDSLRNRYNSALGELRKTRGECARVSVAAAAGGDNGQAE